MKTPAFYAFIFGLSLSSCQTVKEPQGLAHPQPAVAPTAHSKTKVSVKKEEPKHNFFQNLFSKKEAESTGEPHETKEDRKPRFFGQIWVRPGGCLFDRDGQTLYIEDDDGRDDDPDAMSYLALKRKYGGGGPRKSSGDQRVFKLVWKPYHLGPRKPKAQPPILPLEQAGPLQ